MCDYSLQGLPNRLAVEGEELVTHRFPTGSLGMASPLDIAAQNRPRPQTAEPETWWSAFKRWLSPAGECDAVPAVCIPPGTRLLMARIPDVMRREFGLDVLQNVTFTQLSAEAYRYRDAIQFADGRQVLLQAFPEDVLFEVLETAPIESEGEMVTRDVSTISRTQSQRAAGIWRSPSWGTWTT
jgi:hypothetical protein